MLYAGIFRVGKEKKKSISELGKGWNRSRKMVPRDVTAGNGSTGLLPADTEDKDWDKPQKLKPKSTKLQVLIGVGIFSVVWNGIVSVFVYSVFFDGQFGGEKIFFALFLIPFVVVGIGMIVFFFHSLLSMFNPRIEIAMSTGAVPRGGTVDVAWEFKGRVSRIRRLLIEVVGTENATYTRGTSTYTDTEDFCKLTIVDTRVKDEMAFGSQAVEIPATTMHTFEANRNQITWAIRSKGEIPFWPDVNATFGFRVKPGA